MKKILIALLITLVLGLTASLFILPEPATHQETSRFSAPDAKRYLLDLAQESTPIYSQAKLHKAERLVNYLKGWGLNPEIQKTSFLDPTSRFGGDLSNVVVRFKPQTPNPSLAPVLFIAHYDTVPYGPGAIDNGTGVVVLLETAHALSQQATALALNREIIILWADGEEYAQLGAKAFLRDEKTSPALVINLDTFIDTPAFIIDTGDNNEALFALLAEAKTDIRAYSWIAAATTLSLPGNNDYAPYKLKGIPGATIGSTSLYKEYHSKLDTTALVSLPILQQAGDAVLRLALTAGQSQRPSFQGSNQHFLTLPLVGLVTFPVEAMIILLVISLAGFLFSLLKKAPAKGFPTGKVFLLAGLEVVLLLVTVILTFVFDFLKNLINTDLALPRYSSHLPLDLFFALSFVVLPLVTWLFFQRIVLKKHESQVLLLAQSLFWNFLSVAVLFLLPQASFLFVIPAFLLSLTLVLQKLWPQRDFSLVKTLAPLSTILLILPALVILFTGLGLRSLLVLSLGSFFLFAPWFARPLQFQWSRVLPVSVGALFLVLFVQGLLFTRFDEQYPLPSYLGYHVNNTSQKAAWSVLAGPNTPWQRKFVPQEDIKLAEVSPFPTLIPSLAHTAKFTPLPEAGYKAQRAEAGSNRSWIIELSTTQEGTYLVDWAGNELVESFEIQGKTYPASQFKVKDNHGGFSYFTENKAPMSFIITFKNDLVSEFSLTTGFVTDTLPQNLGVSFDSLTLPQNNTCTVVSEHRLSPSAP